MPTPSLQSNPALVLVNGPNPTLTHEAERKPPASWRHRIAVAWRYLLHKVVPWRVHCAWRRWRLHRRLNWNLNYDQRRFFTQSSLAKSADEAARLRALITMDYHRLEKGLALASPRPGFGQDVVDRLVGNLRTYLASRDIDQVAAVALNALSAWSEFQAGHGISSEAGRAADELQDGIGCRQESRGGTLATSRESIHAAARRELSDFFSSRHSVRDFAPDPVAAETIRQAVEMAQRTPSVCNRQSARVYAFFDPVRRLEVLACQNGNRGFREQIAVALVVTSDLRAFVSAGERNQCWIDGGMFAMSLVYALHSLGLGTCCLNWSVERDVDERLHQVAEIPPHEAVIMMIAVGHLPEQLKVAQSPRIGLDEVLRIR